MIGTPGRSLVLVLAVLAGGPAAESAPPPSDVTAVRAARLLDVTAGVIRSDQILVIRDGKVVSIGPAQVLKPPDGARVIELTRGTVLPGLIDAHVHLAWAPASGASTGTLPGAEEALATLRAGFTSVRNLGSTGRTDLALRDAIESGTVPGPRMQAAGPALGIEGGVCDRVFGGEGRADGLEAVVRRTREILDGGADVVKLCAGGSVMPGPADATALEYAEADIRAIVEEAHRRGRKVAAHAQGPAAIAGAVRAGVDSIEHGGLIDEETALLMKQRGTYLVPTLYRMDWALENAKKTGAPAETRDRLQAARDTARAHVANAMAKGVKIAMGTDATVYPHGLNARELAVYVQLGMAPAEALRTATVHAAALMGWSERIGTLEAGRSADLIAIDGDPLADVSALEHVLFVMRGGRVYRDETRSSP